MNDTSKQLTDKTDINSDSTRQKSNPGKIISIISVIISFMALVTSVVIAIIANELTDTIRREALDTRNITTYQRYEDLLWSDDPVKEARAVAFFRRDGNLGFKCDNLYAEFVEAQNSLDSLRNVRLRKHLITIFGVSTFEDIENSKCK